MKEGGQGDAGIAGTETFVILQFRSFNGTARMKGTQAQEIFTPVLSKSIRQCKAELYPLLIGWCNVCALLFNQGDNPFHIIVSIVAPIVRTYLIAYRHAVFIRACFPLQGYKRFL
ncbi:hypothetical protein [Palleniella muris]|uniref:hypothetical protein n=1 Tax=Palleniella muris TaxID=3038145 RepID=UPI00240F9145|nr:hypothetical protein [Palleniella muris]